MVSRHIIFFDLPLGRPKYLTFRLHELGPMLERPKRLGPWALCPSNPHIFSPSFSPSYPSTFPPPPIPFPLPFWERLPLALYTKGGDGSDLNERKILFFPGQIFEPLGLQHFLTIKGSSLLDVPY